MASKFAEIVVFIAVGALTGILSDQARRREAALRDTTRELTTTNSRLQETFDQLRRADRLSAVGQLAASLAHEIRNPLGSIEGAVDIVERTASDERRSEFLGVIRKEARRLNALLSNLLDFSRPRSPEMQPVRIDSVVAAVVDLISHNVRQKGIEVELQVSPELPLIDCDAEQIKQALLNITLNAVQASEAGERISVSVLKENDAVLIKVSDEGKGIDESSLEKIFEPFYTTKERGTGLGLPISHQIVAQHKGRITAERNPDKGMTFTLTLPIRQRPQ